MKTLLVSSASFKQLLNKVDLRCVRVLHTVLCMMCFVSIVLSHYVFYICFVFLVLTTSTTCELFYSNAVLLHAVVNCILLMSISVLAENLDM